MKTAKFIWTAWGVFNTLGNHQRKRIRAEAHNMAYVGNGTEFDNLNDILQVMANKRNAGGITAEVK